MSARRTCQVLQDPLAEDELLVGRFGGHHHCLHHRPVVQRVDQRFRLRHLPLGFGERRVLGEVCFKPFQGQAGMGAQCCSQSPRPQTPRDAFPRSEPSPAEAAPRGLRPSAPPLRSSARLAASAHRRLGSRAKIQPAKPPAPAAGVREPLLSGVPRALGVTAPQTPHPAVQSRASRRHRPRTPPPAPRPISTRP